VLDSFARHGSFSLKLKNDDMSHKALLQKMTCFSDSFKRYDELQYHKRVKYIRIHDVVRSFQRAFLHLLMMLLFASLLLLAHGCSCLHFSPRFVAEKGWFVQGDAYDSKPSNVGFQFPDFGSLKPWHSVHQHLEQHPQTKLLLMVRHGEGVHNLVLSIVGSEMWENVISKLCWYRNYHIFDPSLTQTGRDQSTHLNEILKANGTLEMLMGSAAPPLVLTSPLMRTTETALGVFEGIEVKHNKLIASEYLRESTEGGHPCDARRSISDPPNGEGIVGNCTFDQGYQTLHGDEVLYPRIINGQGFGMFSDADEFFSQDHPETLNQMHLRAAGVVQALFTNFPSERVVFTVTHSETIAGMMETLGLRHYEAANAELVPVLIRDLFGNIE
jgi:broad specificity phosphatase PhoE